MSNWAPVLVVDGAGVDEVAEAPGDVEGTVLSFFDPQPDIPNTTAAERVRAAALICANAAHPPT